MTNKMFIGCRTIKICALLLIGIAIDRLEGRFIDVPADIQTVQNDGVNRNIFGEAQKNASFALNLFDMISANNNPNTVIEDHHLTHVHGHHLRHSTPVLFAKSAPVQDDAATKIICSDSSEDFPQIFSPQQRKHGTVVICVFIGIYCFTLLAIICDNYFLPCVERFCEVFDISEDVGAATFMSIATSAPEFFVNVIGTFITKSDIGLGTIVGSSMFNTLGVASLGGLFAAKPIIIDWCPLTRDVIIYIFSITLLVTISWDGKIFWYEGLILFIAYFIYFVFMFQTKRIARFLYRCVDGQIDNKELISNSGQNSVAGSTNVSEDTSNNTPQITDEAKMDDDDEAKKKSCCTWIMQVYTAPIRFILYLTVPHPKKHSKLFPLTFIMCIVWIGTNSYIVSWMITVLGTTFGITDAVLGLTFLAAGGCLPEAISISITSKRGEGKMGISNALGANTMNILLSLGMPWFFKTISLGINDYSYIQIDSGSIEYTILALVAVALCLYFTLLLNKFALSRISGSILLTMYVVWIILAILSELVFFERRSCTV